LHYDIKTIGKPVSESTLEMRRLHIASMAICVLGIAGDYEVMGRELDLGNEQ